MGYMEMDNDFRETKELFATLVGKTCVSIEPINDDGEIVGFVFTTDDQEKFQLEHEQICCETVIVGEVEGDIRNLIDSRILMAEVVSNPINFIPFDTDSYEEYQWTYYKLATIKGYVTISFKGGSNGCYTIFAHFKKGI